MNRAKSFTETYFLANKVILVIILIGLLYIMSTEYLEIGISCQYKILYGKECRSCGLTRGLRESFKGNFEKAKIYNSQSIFMFIALLSQLLVRFSLVFFLKIKKLISQNINLAVAIDICILSLLFFLNKFIYG